MENSKLTTSELAIMLIQEKEREAQKYESIRDGVVIGLCIDLVVGVAIVGWNVASKLLEKK